MKIVVPQGQDYGLGLEGMLKERQRAEYFKSSFCARRRESDFCFCGYGLIGSRRRSYLINSLNLTTFMFIGRLFSALVVLTGLASALEFDLQTQVSVELFDGRLDRVECIRRSALGYQVYWFTQKLERERALNVLLSSHYLLASHFSAGSSRLFLTHPLALLCCPPRAQTKCIMEEVNDNVLALIEFSAFQKSNETVSVPVTLKASKRERMCSLESFHLY